MCGNLSKSNGTCLGGFENGINPELSNGFEGSLFRSNFLITGFTGVASGQRKFVDSVNFKGMATGWGRSISSGKGIDVLLLHETASNKSGYKKNVVSFSCITACKFFVRLVNEFQTPHPRLFSSLPLSHRHAL